MNVKTLSMMAGVGGAMLLAAPSQADFTGMVAERIMMDNAGNAIPDNFVTLRIYATFSDASDRGIGIVGSPSNPLSWMVSGGTFFDSAVGTDGPPLDALLGLPGLESLSYDSWITIGNNAGPTAGLTIAPGTGMTDGNGTINGATEWNGGHLADSATNSAWTRTPDDPLTLAGDGLRVLVAQLTVAADSADGSDVEVNGTMGVLIQEGGVNSEVAGTFTYIPAPGALALLGLAGLAGTRRRRA